jgi:hypothetical protein
VELLLFLFGGLAAILFIVNNIARTALRQRRIVVAEIALAFFVALLPASGLLVNNLNTATFDSFEQIIFLLIIPIMIIHVGLLIVESFRPQRLRQSRGILGLGVGLVLMGANFSYNFIALNAQLGAVEREARPTPVNSLEDRDPCTVSFESLFVNLLDIVGGATNLTVEEILLRAADDGSISLAQLVEENGGDPDQLVTELVAYLDPAARDLLAEGCLEQATAGLFLSQLRFVVRRFVVDDFVTLQTFFGGAAGGAEVSEDDLRATRVALLESVQQATPIPTLTSTPTATLTSTPTVTRTPFPTLTPTPTRERFATATPTMTATLPDPCIATTRFNVNLRTLPDVENGQVLITIPFGTSLSVFAPDAQRSWWYAQFGDQTGWVNGEFITLTDSCYQLPARTP